MPAGAQLLVREEALEHRRELRLDVLEVEVLLVQLRVAGFPILSDWHVAYPAAKPLSLIAERFLEFVLKRGPDVLPLENLERQVQEALAKV